MMVDSPHRPSRSGSSPLAWTADMLHFFGKRSSIDSNPSSDDGAVDDSTASPSSSLSSSKHMFKSLLVRRFSKHRLLLDESHRPLYHGPTIRLAPTAPSTLHSEPEAPPGAAPSSLRSTVLLDEELQPTSVDWNPHYPWFCIVTEIVDTEVTFVETLQTLHQVFNHVFHDKHKYSHPSLLALRSATASLLTLHMDICDGIRRPADMLHLSQDTLHLARVFQTHLPYFKLYAQYCLAYTDVSTMLRVRKRIVTTELQQFVAAICAAAQLLQVDLQSEMIKPVQRLCRYPLLMSELRHHAPEALQHTLQDLLHATKVVAATVNDRVQADQNNAKFLRLRRKLQLGFGCPEVMVPTRQYVMEAAVHVATQVRMVPWTMLTTRPQTLVLLSDVLLITKRRRHKRLQVCKVLPLILLTVDEISAMEFPKWSRAKCFVLRCKYRTASTDGGHGGSYSINGHGKSYVVVCDCEKRKLELLSVFRDTLAQVADAMASPGQNNMTMVLPHQPFALRQTRLASSVTAV
ncbi:hypothetical protein, variant 1 [Aphanomyces invadans]|uniref:DH domain-containing protein n=1 Tax=Aphanomyces invadans TaxID=157072 RepID=A0A024U8W2_9STRA|nr:hypothetical protein, variant 1 [Aphanomyces invadans]ETW02846.1 hypothetical protein, variant 1 [Aphanomyces invadans]|eukprot:XP_008868230.1 hypothetical protein, variant 1 [Aphanomyces invadans]